MHKIDQSLEAMGYWQGVKTYCIGLGLVICEKMACDMVLMPIESYCNGFR